MENDSDTRDFHDVETVQSRISFVWFVPLIALLLSLGVAWNSYAQRGPLIEITLDNATGVEAGKTVVKRRDVDIGVVEDVSFTEDGSKVVITARMDKDVARFVDQEAQFWVVSPQVSVQGISGLDTVLSGSYIEASWDREIGEEAYSFTALANPPLTPPDTPGRRVKLIAEDGGSMGIGAPVFYKRIEVGRIESKELTPDGEAVVFELFVEAPHHLRLTEGSRFWNASGVQVEIGTEGAKIRLESFSSFLRGGITFDTVALGGGPVQQYHVFRLFPGEPEARASIFDDDFGAQIRLSITFDGSIRGLSVGAPVELRGYKVGEVIDVLATVEEEDGVPAVSLVTTVLLQPSRLGLPSGQAEESLDFLKLLVRNGLRAKLASASLITGSLYVELVEQPDMPIEEIDETASPYPRLPSVNSDLDDLAASAEGVLNRINALPIEALMTAATDLMRNIDVLVQDEETRAVPAEVRGLLADTRKLVGDPSLTAATTDLAAAIAAVRGITEGLQEADAAASLVAALNAATETAAAVTSATEGAPALIENFTQVGGLIADLPLAAMVVSATQLVNSANVLVASPETQQLPASAAGALEELQAVLAELRGADAVANLSLALEEAGQAAAAIRAAAARAPAMMENLSTLSQTASDLPLDDLVTSATRLVRNADTFVGSEAIAALPADLSAALDDVRVLLSDLRDADAATNLATALARAGEAATSISEAAASAPDLIATLTDVAEKARDLPLETLIASSEKLMRDANSFVNSEGIQAVPPALTASLASVQRVLDDLTEDEISRRLALALDDASRATIGVSNAVQGVPAVLREIEALSMQVRSLPFDQLIGRTNQLLSDIDRIVTAPGAEQIPASIVTAFDQVRITIADLQARNVPENFNNALVSFNGASLSFQQLSANLNTLMPQVSALAGRADSVLSEFDVGSELNYEAITTIREIRDAARAITALVATIERRPNSLILGK